METDADAETMKDRLIAVSVDTGGTIGTVPEVVIGDITVGTEAVELAAEVSVGAETGAPVREDIGMDNMAVPVSVGDEIGIGITETVVGAELGIEIIPVPVEVSVGVGIGTIGVPVVSVGIDGRLVTTTEV